MAGEPADAEEDAKWWRHKRSSGVSAEYSRPSSAASIRSVRSSVRSNRSPLMLRPFRCSLTWCLSQAPAEEGGSKTSMTAVDLSGRKRPPSARVRLRPQSAGGVRVPKAVAPVNSGYSGAPSRGRVRSRPVSASASASGSSLWRSRPRGGIPHGQGGPGVKTTQRGGYAFPPVRSKPSCSCCLAPLSSATFAQGPTMGTRGKGRGRRGASGGKKEHAGTGQLTPALPDGGRAGLLMLLTQSTVW